ncbi:MAG: LUD domain-containing protein [Aliidongia sp.]
MVPAVHKLRTVVAEVFAKTIGTDAANDDVHYLAEAQREATRPLILGADAGMTGGNFIVAETGGFVVCTNEGNADLSANVPKLHIASIGIEKIIPRLEHLAVFVRLLSRSALGSPMTQYTSHFRGPRAGGEMHVVLVDNGRSERLGLEEFWTSLKCIRCGACMNTCPVYRRSGGLSYGATYSGPIGLIIDPTFQQAEIQQPALRLVAQRQLHQCLPGEDQHPRADLCLAARARRGARGSVRQEGGNEGSRRIALDPHRLPCGHRHRGQRAHPHSRFALYNRLNAWGKHRELPHPPAQSFHSWYQANRGRKAMSSRDDILAAIRTSRPKLDRPLPQIPMFDNDPPASTARCLQGQPDPHGRPVSRAACFGRPAGTGPDEDRRRQDRVVQPCRR